MEERNKTEAILRLVEFQYNWTGWITYNKEKESMKSCLDEIVEDIYIGHITCEAFENTITTASERIGRAEGDFVDDCILYVKRKVIEKYKRIDYLLSDN